MSIKTKLLILYVCLIAGVILLAAAFRSYFPQITSFQFLTFSVAVILSFFVVTFVQVSRIARSLDQLTKDALRIVEGDLNGTVNESIVRNEDETGALARAIDEMLRKLRDERKRLEKEIQDRTAESAQAIRHSHSNEQRLQQLIDSTPNAIIMANKDGKIVLVNKMTETLFGYSRQELLFQPIEKLIPKEFRAKHPEHRNTFFKNPESRSMGAGRDLHGLRKDGTQVLVEIGLNPVETPEGAFVLASVVDITERKRLEEKFVKVVESAPNAIIMVNKEGKIVLVNKMTESLFGYSRQDLIDQSVDILVPGQFRAHHAGHRSEFFKKPEIRSMGAGRDLYGQRKDGTQVPVEIGLNPVETQEGMFVLASIVDITERKTAEIKFQSIAAELKRSNEDLEQFAYVASHDLQEPLRMVASYTQLLARRYKDVLDKEANEFITYAVDGANRMQRLISDLLTFSRVGTRGKGFTRVDCNAICRDAIVSLKVAVEEGHAQITCGQLPVVMADETQMLQLFQNVIGNAVKFRKDKQAPQIDISAKELPDAWEFCIKDNGIGMNPQYSDRVFIIFERLHTSEQYEGTGIGLAVCKKIVERHGGRVWIESEEGKGTKFYFTISKRNA